MLQLFFHAPLFWPLILGGLLFYYGWVGYAFFRPTFLTLFSSLFRKKDSSTKQLSISLDDLTCAFALQRKLIESREQPLEPHERILIQQFPFKELLRMY
jgi:hypothetical protein